MLRRVAGGASPDSLRLYRPDDVVLFSSLDARRPGFARAVELAAEAGFGSVIRLAGGHAAAFLEESMAFAWATRDPDARNQIRARFERLAALVARALRGLGLDARIGEISGEYCPGEFSVNIAGRVKVMGVGQRVIRGGAHVGGVLTVGHSERLRGTLIRVYDALELEFRPQSAGGIGDFDSGIAVEDVVESMQRAFEAEGVALYPERFDDATLEAAKALAPMHYASARGSVGGESLRSIAGKTLLQADRLASRDDPM